MSTLLLRFAAPMQSWGCHSKFDRRLTEQEPTKSGILGLLACAMGLQRDDSLEVFDSLRLGVRVDQAGRLGRDYQIVQEYVEKKGEQGRKQDKKKDGKIWVTNRYYLQDAVFLVAIEGEQGFLSELQQALQHPVFPLFLGRRSCPPSGPLTLGIREGGMVEILRTEPWQASEWYRKRMSNMSKRKEALQLEIVRDAVGEEQGYSVRDVPISFSQKRRKYGFRNVIREHIPLHEIWQERSQAASDEPVRTEHNPMALLEEEDVSVKS